MKALSAHDAAMIAEGVIVIVGIAQFAAVIAWSVWVVRAYRNDVKRVREGLCLKCGFDLRQSVDRCPECGAPIFKK